MKNRYINLGCGGVRPEGWENYDSSLNSLMQSLPVIRSIVKKLNRSVEYERPAKYMDLRRKWPFDDSSVSVVYASHVLEHLRLHDAQHFLSEAFRSLIDGGGNSYCRT